MTDPAVQRLLDLEELRSLKARYVRCVDTHDWPGLRAVFADEVVIDTSNDDAGVRTDPDEFVAGVARVLEHTTSLHRLFLPELDLTGADTAAGTWAMEDDIWWPPGGPVAHLHGAGHYQEAYLRTPDGWRITAMTLTRTFRRLTGPDGTEIPR